MIKYELKNIATYEKLYEAHLRARKCKRYKNEVVKFEIDMFYHINNLSVALQNGTYRIKSYKRFMIYDPKEREIQALAYRDRVVQNCLCYNFLVPYYTKKLIFDNGACRKQKGTHFTRSRLEGFMSQYFKQYGNNGYFLRLDIKKYFNNIDHEILKQKLGKIHDQDLKNLVYHVIDSYEHSPGKGVPMGNQSSQIFALLYLNNIDRIIKEKFQIKYYVRYMDDLLILHNNKQFLKDLFALLKKEIISLNLEVNKKSEIIPIKNGIEFLGVHYKILPSGKILKRMKTQSKRRMLKRIKDLKNDFEAGKIDKFVINQSLAGFKGNIKRLTVNGLNVKYIGMLKNLINTPKPAKKKNANARP
ncbi:MAG: RNA-directed DNA polymerase [Clostridia bacterium]|nr:RNA-directed DNA polymerase [Clostridia bacterium]